MVNQTEKARSPKNRLALVMVMLILVGAIAGAVVYLKPYAPGELITLAEYNRIQNGMSYAQVAKIIGSNGRLTLSISTGGKHHTKYAWKGYGDSSAMAVVRFADDEVYLKDQRDLK